MKCTQSTENPCKTAFKRLRANVLDSQRHSAPRAMIECAAHMLVYFDQPTFMKELALSHLIERLSATCAVLEFGSPEDLIIRLAAAEVRMAPEEFGYAYPNQHPALQAVWRSRTPVLLDVDALTAGLDPQPSPERRGTRWKLTKRLEHQRWAFGLVFLDQSEEGHPWGQDELDYFDQFVTGFLSPIMAQTISQRHPSFQPLTDAELTVIRSVAQGLSYKEIAVVLGKSPNTVDNQLRQIRTKLKVRNQVELLTACAHLL